MESTTKRLIVLTAIAASIAVLAYFLVKKIEASAPVPQPAPTASRSVSPESQLSSSGPASKTISAAPDRIPETTPLLHPFLGREHLTEFALLLSLTLAILCLMAARWALGWRRAAAGSQISILPSEVLDKFEGLEGSMGRSVAVSRSVGDDVSSRVASIGVEIQKLHVGHAEVFKSLQILQDALVDRDAEIKRLRKGGDQVVFRKFLGRFLKVLIVIDEEIEAARRSGAAPKALEDVRLYVEEALEECGVSRFAPKVGERMQDAFGLGDGAEHEQRTTENPELHGTIAEVIRCGYAVTSLEGRDCLRGAVVAFFVKTSEVVIK